MFSICPIEFNKGPNCRILQFTTLSTTFCCQLKKGRQVLDASSSRFFMMKQLENCSQKCYCCPHFRSFFRWPMKKRIHQQRSTSPQFIVPLQTAEIVTEPFSLAILITRLDSSSLLKNTQKTRSVQNPNDHLFGKPNSKLLL